MMEEVSLFKTIYPEEVYSIPPPLAVVIGIPWAEVNDAQRLLLSRILQAIRLSVDGVRIVHQASLDLSAWGEKPAQVIAFLSPPKGLASYESIETGKASVVFSDPLEILVTDDQAKRKLWNILKTLF